MDLNQLRSFHAVAESGNLTRAAERLHLSQPAVSAQIKALEDSLEQKLFHRSSSGMELTQAGRRLLELAERVMAAAEDLKLAARAMKGNVSGRLRIGTLSDPQFIRLGEFMGRALARYPLLELELQTEISGTALEHVKDGELDASFYFGEVTDAGIATLPLGEMAYRIAAPGAWGERMRDADWHGLAAMPWVLPPENSTITRRVRALFGEHGAELTTHIGADNEGVIVNLVESGVGLSLLREDLAFDRQAAGAVAVWEGTRIATQLAFAYLRERAHDPAIGALLQVLRETWPAGSPAARRRASILPQDRALA